MSTVVTPVCSSPPAAASPWWRWLTVAFALGAGDGAAAAETAAAACVETSLAPRSQPDGPTLFTPLPPEATGIVTTNRYTDPRMWNERYHEFGVGAIGTGVAVGDYDGDGRPDIFVVSKTGSGRLFRNLGGWKFQDVTEAAGVEERGAAADEWKQGATFADVNNDGRLDLYVCRFAAPNLLYVNQGDGTFREEAAARGLAVVDASGMAAFCDYDRDGWLDVYVQTNLGDAAKAADGQPDFLFRNRGDGTFTDVTAAAGIRGRTQGHSATWWDQDRDGWPDLYVANDFAAPDRLYRNLRDGTFVDVLADVVPHTPMSSMGADLADFNNDGLIDFLVADMAATTAQKDQRGMADSRARARDEPRAAGAALTAPQYLRNALYLNTGTPRVLEAAHLAGLDATDWTWSVRGEDLDNDGRVDVHVTNGMNREQHNADLLARMMAAETPVERVRLMKMSPVLAEANLAFRNRGDLQFENVSAAWGLDQKGVSFGAAFGDFDGDGDLDLVFANYEAGVTVLRNDALTGHRAIVELRGTSSNRFGVGATVEIETAAGGQVRQLVLARGYLSSSEPVLHFGLGEITTIQKLRVSWPGGAVQEFTDLPADRRYTITEPPAPARRDERSSAQPPRGFVEIGETAGLSFLQREAEVDETAGQALLPRRGNRRGPAVAVGDLDGDGRDDVVLGGTTEDARRVMRGVGRGRFEPLLNADGSAPDATLNDGPLLIFDADGDGDNDLLITKGGVALPAGAPEYQPRLLLNDGQGGWQPADGDALPPLSLSAGAATAADFDRDGRLDVFIGAHELPGLYPLAPRSALLRNLGGKFEDVTDAVAGLRECGLVTSALWSDADGDGWADLLVATEWGGVRYWHNQAGRGFEERSAEAGFAAAGAGWWTSLATADFNGDGRPDYVAGNVGLNTPYRATPEQPALLYYGEFASGAAPQIVEARHDGDRSVPWRNRRQLGGAIPSVLKRFPRNDAYARASLAEILGEDRLRSAERRAATEFRSGVFLSEGAGVWRFQALPRIAQIAPFQGVVAGDFDGDGCADIYAVQNSHAPIPSVGRFDGGLSQLLLGDGRGGFVAVAPGETQLVVSGDAKGLAVIDLDEDGWPDFVVTRNHAPTLAYRNPGVGGRQALAVRLRGARGNPQAVGARVTLVRADGTSQTSEVTAGSGHVSQSSAVSFFVYPEARPPRQLQVRWPSGAMTTHAAPKDATWLTLEEPSR